MADYCCNAYMRELDVDVHRWLPSEILSDIGVVVDTTESRRLAVVEDLAARLAGVLGGSTVERTRHPAVPPSTAPPAEAWHLLSNNGGRMTLDQAVPLPRFALARQRPPLANAILPPARRSGGGGTGVFLPRTGAYNGTRSSRPTGGDVNAACVNPPRHSKQQQHCRPSRQRRRGEEDDAARRPSRRQLHGLHAHAVAAAAGRPAGAAAAPGGGRERRTSLVARDRTPAGMGLLTTRPKCDAHMIDNQLGLTH
ncbi:hypothetical protein E2562_004075 [Oryza meyeriana var. granulata]|uniref:Uncharacterized protein n=1 Tax=Oryza meyeriana var. granulata TaxID=110450 RepID=A0A6G1BJB0_9ORYZ|nr:hypothetical protein E2562_004075 [Oryza meyeriana var. granulata]